MEKKQFSSTFSVFFMPSDYNLPYLEAIAKKSPIETC